MNGISVIVCCYNSEKRLPETLKHLALQEVASKITWEVIVVDNNSSDKTKEIALQEWKKFNSNVPFSVIEEKQPGLSNARNKGLRKAQFNLILFCDDDNWLNYNYLQAAYEIMAKHPEIGCLGGYNEAIADQPLPAWFKDFEQGYACGPQGKIDNGWDRKRTYINGAGMVLRKSIFDKLDALKFTSLLSDRKGTVLNSGGDAELSIVAMMLGYNLFYSSELRLKHYMTSNRITWEYLVNMYKGHSRSEYILHLYRDVYYNKPLKSTWFYETIIRLYYFIKRNGFTKLVKWVTVKNREGDLNSIIALWETEQLLAHLKHIQYASTVKKIRSFYKSALNTSNIGKFNV